MQRARVPVLIPVLSGWFFRPRGGQRQAGKLGLNPRAFGVVFQANDRKNLFSKKRLNPRAFGVVFQAGHIAFSGGSARGLNPRAFGVVFQAEYFSRLRDYAQVLLPVLSGWFFRHVDAAA